MTKKEIEAKRVWVKSNAEKIIVLSIMDAARLPGFLGKIVPIQLMEFGWYAAKSEDKITYYELEGKK